MSKEFDTESWDSKWITIPDDIDGERFVICDNCSYNLGYLGLKITPNKFPRVCPECKRYMTNGVK